MACNQCTPCTNCTPPTPVSTSCEECADIISSSCVYYKGSYGNNLGLPANFRFNNFAEKVLKRLSNLPDDLVDTSIASIAYTKNSNFLDLTTTITLTDADDTEITGSLDLRRYYTIVEFDESNKVIGGNDTILLFKTNAISNFNVNHNSSGFINPLTTFNQGGRTGLYKLSANFNFRSSLDGTLTIKVLSSNTVIASNTITISQDNYTSFYIQVYNSFELVNNVLPTKDYSIRLSFINTDEESVTLSSFKGTWEVSEVG